MVLYSAPFVIGAVLLLLAGIGGAACSFGAPVGRRALTGIGSALIAAAGLVFLVLPLWGHDFIEVLSGAFGGRTAFIVLDVVDYGFTAGLGAGLILLAFAATKRLSRPAPGFAPHQRPHAPGPPHQYGPVQG